MSPYLVAFIIIVKCLLLLLDVVTAPVEPLSFVTFTNRLTILRSCEAPAEIISDPSDGLTPFTVNVKLSD